MAKKQLAHRLRHIVAVSNYKGGIGKTTTVMNLGAALVQRLENYRVLLIDIDSSCGLSNLLGWTPERELQGEPTLFNALTTTNQGLPVYPTARKNLYLCPSSTNLSKLSDFIKNHPNLESDPDSVLKDALDRPLDIRVPESCDLWQESKLSPTLSDLFDFVLIDSQPTAAQINDCALYAADGCIIPTELEEESIKGMTKLAVAAGKIASKTGRLTIHGILITKYIKNRKITQYYEPNIRKMFSETFNTVIRNTKDVGDSRAFHEDVFTTYNSGKAAEDYISLASEYLKKYA